MRYETTTRLAPEEALAVAERFFNDEYGLPVMQRSQQELRFEGGGGHVFVGITGQHPTTLEIETREWDAPVIQFIENLPH